MTRNSWRHDAGSTPDVNAASDITGRRTPWSTPAGYEGRGAGAGPYARGSPKDSRALVPWATSSHAPSQPLRTLSCHSTGGPSSSHGDVELPADAGASIMCTARLARPDAEWDQAPRTSANRNRAPTHPTSEVVGRLHVRCCRSTRQRSRRSRTWALRSASRTTARCGTSCCAGPTSSTRSPSALRDELGAALDAADADNGVRVVLVRAEGKAFCAGFGLDWSTVSQASRGRRARAGVGHASPTSG